jgi:hypothetical protein
MLNPAGSRASLRRFAREVMPHVAAPPRRVATVRGKLRRLAAGKQKRLDALMAGSNDGRLTDAEGQELRALLREVEEIMLDNARRLAE